MHISDLIKKTPTPHLIKTLKNQKSSPNWTPQLITQTLKSLWNDGPKAFLLFTHLSKTHQSLTLESFDLIIDILGRMRDFKKLWSLVSEMPRHGLHPSHKTFAIIMERYVSAGKADRAIRAFSLMQIHGCPPNLQAFNTLLDILCKSKRVERAQELFRALRHRFKPDTITYNILADGWCIVRKTQMAVRVFREMVELDLSPSLSTYNILLKGFFRTGELTSAWSFFVEMKKRGCVPDAITYTTLVHGFGMAGDLDKACKIFEGVKEKGCLPNVATYNAMIMVLCKKGPLERAKLIFSEMENKGYEPNLTTYNLLIRAFSHDGRDMEGALGLLERMREKGCTPSVQTHNILMRSFCEIGEVERAFEVWERMEGEGCFGNLDSYNVMLSALCVNERREEFLRAGKMVVEMVERGHVPQRLVFTRVVNGLLLTGNQGFAKELLRVQSQCKRLCREIRL
ncbi:hypothetical protein AMTRI_Chr04g189960 [Amborella trichopoda]|uniref:Pentacotripeptide-repeat region of PRORP domain-containing protein n=1 Tax=Amborella trichopoda TaxID=13333 RepID=W1NG11_AMBTC|nr:pentatricopeptide repeat-containing protein At1g74900, mitochondrial [Amborella trichopoda]ERM94418.1 hypothetical protein AMTR_s00010p00256660 [Amborella trichopoda]|eukprot:XP_020519960.1 pentatricopeptide repeat-containing protein At1g74900, mitochondrial [Amborella trichopoda]